MAKDMGKLRALSPEELEKEEVAMREEIWKLRLQVSTGQSQNPYQVRSAKRDLARVLTVQREKQLAEQGGKTRGKKA